jgi:hypothetical protein
MFVNDNVLEKEKNAPAGRFEISIETLQEQMSHLYLLRPSGSVGMSQPHWIRIEKDVASMGVIGMDLIYARPPYTTGKDEACIELTIRLVQDLFTIDQGGEESIRAMSQLKEQMDSVKGQLVTEDIESVMCTVRGMVTDAAWDKIQALFLIFLRDDYCKDFFDNVYQPAMLKIHIPPDNVLYTGYQALSGSSSEITDAVKDITDKVDTKELLTKMCFIRFYGKNNVYDTIDKVIGGLIISSFLCIHANTA